MEILCLEMVPNGRLSNQCDLQALPRRCLDAFRETVAGALPECTSRAFDHITSALLEHDLQCTDNYHTLHVLFQRHHKSLDGRAF